MLENVFNVNNKELQVDSKERSIGRVGMNNLWFVNHKSIFCSHKLKICKISIFHKSFFLKYDYFKIASTGDLCLSVCLDLDRQISCKNKKMKRCFFFAGSAIFLMADKMCDVFNTKLWQYYV